jgi:hypothetical protein
MHGYTVVFWVAAGVFAFGAVVLGSVMHSIKIETDALTEPAGWTGSRRHRSAGRATGGAESLSTLRTPRTVWTLREGKIVRVSLFAARADALEAAGLRE